VVLWSCGPVVSPSVTVLIPTVDRYPYLRTLLTQLRSQTVPPLEIIIVDQTAQDRRDLRLKGEFADLPLRIIYQDQPGQCTSRNAGLQAAQGDHILFIDDDDEVPPDLIEAHLATLAQFQADVSSGVADEVGAGPLPPDFQLLRASDVFPTNNSMIRNTVLHRSGLFDLAYDRRQRADGDLGMRIYLAGALMVLNPSIRVLHHHAPSGGLRKHKARATTYAMARSSVLCRNMCSASEFYLARRYFPPAHAREMRWQSLLGTFSIRGGSLKRFAKILVSAICLPRSLWIIQKRLRESKGMARQFPQIPDLMQLPRAAETPTVPARPPSAVLSSCRPVVL
jgi:glycosyltransferase involved in cell wall biosynthesis